MEAAPVTVRTRLPVATKEVFGADWTEVPVVVDGDRLLVLVFQALFDPTATALLPRLVDGIGTGRTDTLRDLLERILPRYGLFAEGTYYAVQCADEAAFATVAEARADTAAYPRLRGFVRGSDIGGERFLDACAGWGTRAGEAVEDEAVVSDVPTLVLAGRFDPITPPSWGRLAVQTLANGSFFEFPGIGHGVGPAHPCPEGLTVAFVHDPMATPDAACIATMSGPAFAPPI